MEPPGSLKPSSKTAVPWGSSYRKPPLPPTHSGSSACSYAKALTNKDQERAEHRDRSLCPWYLKFQSSHSRIRSEKNHESTWLCPSCMFNPLMTDSCFPGIQKLLAPSLAIPSRAQPRRSQKGDQRTHRLLKIYTKTLYSEQEEGRGEKTALQPDPEFLKVTVELMKWFVLTISHWLPHTS